MGRRGENIRKRVDGRWEARIISGPPVNGKTSYKYIYGKSYQEVREKKRLFLEEQKTRMNNLMPLAQAMPMASNFLFGDAAEQWLRFKRSGLKESSHSCYTVLVRNHLLPLLKDVPITQLTEQKLADFFVNERENTRRSTASGQLSPKTMSDIKSVLLQILGYAKENGLISSVPECPTMSTHQPPIDVLSEQEQDQLIQSALETDTPHALGVLLSLYSGTRIGEVCGLTWADVDLENRTLNIEKTVYRLPVSGSHDQKTKVVIGVPKTACSNRTIPLPDQMICYLQQHRQEDNVYLLTGTKKFMEPRVCLARYKTLLRKAGIADRTYHALRHTFATRCIENGVDVKSLSEIMGHSNVHTTMQLYVHPSLDSKRQQMNKLPFFGLSGQNRGQ